MTTTVAPDVRPDHSESEEWPTCAEIWLTRRAKSATLIPSTSPKDVRSARTPTTTPPTGCGPTITPTTTPPKDARSGPTRTTTPPKDARSGPTRTTTPPELARQAQRAATVPAARDHVWSNSPDATSPRGPADAILRHRRCIGTVRKGAGTAGIRQFARLLRRQVDTSPPRRASPAWMRRLGRRRLRPRFRTSAGSSVAAVMRAEGGDDHRDSGPRWLLSPGRWFDLIWWAGLVSVCSVPRGVVREAEA
jgi:hypothetical protein